MADYLDVADRMWPLLGPLMRTHARIYAATGGRILGTIPGLPSLLLLSHTGARSGTKRTAPLVYMPDGDDIVIVASKGGHPQNPAWLYNLRANPDTQVQIGSKRIAVHAREANEEEHRRLWPLVVDYNPVFGRYQKRAERKIPIVILTPTGRTV